jgi:hypothetical protein
MRRSKPISRDCVVGLSGLEAQDKCQNLKLTYDNWGTLIDVDLQNGNSADANKDLDSPQTYDYAKSQGCAWAY